MRTLIFSLLILILGFLGSISAQTFQFDSIESCSVVSQSSKEIIFDVRYYYAGEQNRTAYLGVEGFEGAQVCDYLSCKPVRLKPGRGVARVNLTFNRRSRKRYTTNRINFFLYHQGQQAFESKALNWKHTWFGTRRPIIAAAPIREVSSYAVCFKDLYISARRDGRGMSISSGQTRLAGDTGWKCAEIRNGVYTLSHHSWKKRSWVIDTHTRQVYESRKRMRGFIQSNKRLPYRVETSRHSFIIRLGDGRITYDVATNNHRLSAGRYVLSDCPNWQTVCVTPTLYHTRNTAWGNSFWAINPIEKKAYSPRRARFQRDGGKYRSLSYTIESQF